MIQSNTTVFPKQTVTMADWLPVAVVLIFMLFLLWTLAFSIAGLTMFAVSGAVRIAESAPAQEQEYINIPALPATEYFTEAVAASEAPAPAEKRLTPITVNAVGDCMLATGLGRPYENSFEYHIQTLQKPYEYFFANVRDIFFAGDINIANGENAFTHHDAPRDKSSHGDRVFWFKSDPDYANIYVEAGINAVNVANNHTRDFGEKGLQDTFEALEEVGVQPFGFGRIAYMEVKGYTIALMGYSLVSRLVTETQMNEAARAVKDDLALAAETADIMIVSFHWGEEYAPEPSPLQECLAQLTIDHGAHLVLGHHSHCLQRVEVYQERLIAYSLGNFVFGGSLSPPKETLILRQTFFMDDESRQPHHIEYELIEAETYGGNGKNNFQPVLGRPSAVQ